MEIDDILKMFCSRDECRVNINTPFNHNGFTYATNGVILVRVPLIKKYQRDMYPDKVEKCLFGGLLHDDDFVCLPDITQAVNFHRCDNCEGKGRDYKCTDCNGRKYVILESNSGIEYEFECKMCYGKGYIPGECEECSGFGVLPEKRHVMVGSKLLGCINLYILGKLPGCKIATEKPEGLQPIPFIFDGGDGIIMPLRQLSDNDDD